MVLEILVLAIIIFYNICWILLAALFIESSVGFDVLEVIIFMFYSLSCLIVLTALILNVFCIFCLLYVFTAVLKGPKTPQVKLFISIVVVVIDCSVSIITFLSLSTTCFAYNTCNGFVMVFVSNTLCLSLFMFLVSVLTFSANMWWCNCCTPNGAPPVPNAATPLIREREQPRQQLRAEGSGQHNGLLEGGQRNNGSLEQSQRNTSSLEGSNSGSSTTSYNPLEMSDCKASTPLLESV